MRRLARSLIRKTRANEKVGEHDAIYDSLTMLGDVILFRPEEDGDDTKSQDFLPPIDNLKEISIAFEQGVTVKNHRFRSKLFPNTFIGSDAVDFMVVSEIATSRKHAVQIARALTREYNQFEHCMRDHDFEDNHMFYCFVDKSKRTEPITKCKAQEMSLDEIASAFENGVSVRNRKYRMITYPNSFIGSEAVEFLMKSNLAETRSDALKLGRKLATEYDLFQSADSARDCVFRDENSLYKFIQEDKRKPRRHIGGETTDVNDSSESSSTANLIQVSIAFEKGVNVRDHQWRDKVYGDSFVASKAVDYLVNSSVAQNRKEAVQLCRRLAQEFNLFRHVTGDHEFKDDYIFFEFVDESERRYPKRMLRRSPVGKHSVVENLVTLASVFRKNVPVKTHRYRLMSYKGTFVGSEAVDYLVKTNQADSRIQAVKLGRQLSQNFNLFEHATKNHRFKDENLFYRFKDNTASNQVSTHSKTMSVSDVRSLGDIARLFRSGIQVSDHKWRLKTYRDSFVGKEAISFLLESGMAKTRDDAVKLGRMLVDEYKLFEHAANDHELKDKHHELKDKHIFYRFTEDSKRPEATDKEIGRGELRNIAQKFETAVSVKDNQNRMKIYRNTFAGTEAIDYLVNSNFARCRLEALVIGRSLASRFNVFEHVTNNHDLKDDEEEFYHFVKKSDRWSLQREEEWKHNTSEEAQRLDCSSELTVEQRWEKGLKGFAEGLLLNEYRRTSRLSSTSSRRSILYGNNIHWAFHWASSFKRLDPRFQIHKFFNVVAQEGGHGIEEKGLNTDIRPLCRYFARASVFTVWRPTSLEAIRKMMLGDAVGKGLDIKGKSAKRGKLSGYVPFLQISRNSDKQLVRMLPKNKTIRLYFTEHSKRGRDQVAEKLELLAEEMIETVKMARQVLADWNSDEESRSDATESLSSLDMTNPAIAFIDDYAPSNYGLEIPVRLFWEFYIAQSDISRALGSEFDTGRPSQPAFQDMNHAAITSAPKYDGAPRAVVWQMSDPEAPMCPFSLLMAYEEHGRVRPVVSDFDCFLAGTRGVSYSTPLPPEQLEISEWCVSRIEAILDSPPSAESWTCRWIDILKEASKQGIHPKIPQFGFGDPKSYAIMKHAVGSLDQSGAVRHGAECFNYLFPQELDDELLVISDQLPGKVPWQYMNANGLQEFLSGMLDKGYTFPLNPKWVLCDPGWKKLYDKLLLSTSKPNVQDSVNVWFPKDSGVREKIEAIHKKHPNGFVRVV